MRPVELVVEGFRSFGERTVFQWRGRRLVGVVGPIGSGKSSILDAVSFALYGKTPAFESHTKSLIKQDAPAARVELAFEVEGAAWRAVRVIRRRGASQHALYRWQADDPDGAIVECEKERDVNARVEELLGLDFQAFRRSVLLAQNRFAEFLHASAGVRDKVLKGVFGFDRLDRMHAAARRRRGEAELAVKELEGRLGALDEDRARLNITRETAKLSARRARRMETAAGRIEELDGLAEQSRRQHREADRRLEELAELEKRLPADEETETVLEAVESSAAALAVAEKGWKRAREAILDAERAAEGTVSEVGSVENLARAESRLGARTRAKTTLERRRRQHVEAEAELDASQKARDEARLELRRTEKDRTAAGRAAKRCSNASERAVTEHREVEQAIGGRAVLEEAGRLLRELERARDGVEQENAGFREIEARAVTARVDLSRAIARHDEAAAAARVAEGEASRAAMEVERLEEEMHRALHAEMAETLRGSLATGEPCPVCRQEVVEVPAGATKSVAAARDSLQLARDAKERSETRLRELSSRAAACAQAVAGGEKVRDEAAEQRAASDARLEHGRAARAKLEAELVARLGEGEPAALLAAAEGKLAAAEERIEAREQKQRVAESAVKDAAHAMEVARRDERSAEAAAKAAAKRLGEVGTDLETAEAALCELDEELRELLGDGDPVTLIESARTRLEASASAVETARDQERQAAASARQERQAAANAGRRAEGLASRLAVLSGQIGAGLRVDDQPLPVEAPEPRALLAAIQARLAAGRAEAVADLEAAKRAENESGEERLGIYADLDLDPENSFDEALKQARSARDRNAARVAEIERRLARAGELEKQLEAANSHLDLYRQLTDDLTAPHFLRYLLDEERASLAEMGSDRFEMLSAGRYRFTRDETFSIVDLANAEAVRRADTLSGGETFLASLALALALAEKVTGGGGRLDAFFLDEGFGSLDREHLDLALDGIERLVTDSPNRLVVVVSHVPEMRERVDDLIVLDKDPLTGGTIVRSGSAGPAVRAAEEAAQLALAE
ncbi:MAG: SMC family ATPase [bacterium]|nr:SMC family ATPase [bacterium]